MSIAFENSLLSCSQSMRAYALKLTKNPESAKDLCQETFCKALANRDKFHPASNMKAWILTIMYNTFANGYRRTSIGLRYVNYRMEQHRIGGDTPVEMQVETQLQVKDVQSEIYRLPEIFRNAIQLYCIGYKYVEIAQMIDEPIGTVKSRIHIARKLLKKRLEK